MQNYLKINKSRLPTKGILYPENFSLKIRPMNISDVKFLATINEENSSDVLNELTDRCCQFSSITIDDLYLADRNFIIFWIRSNSFIINSGYSFDISVCPYCQSVFTARSDLSDFDIDYIKSFNDHIVVDCYDLNVSLPKINKAYLWNATDDTDINDILMYTDIFKYFDTDDMNYVKDCILDNLSALSYAKLIQNIETAKCGISEIISIKCNYCHNSLPVTFKLTETEMFKKINIKHVIEDQLYIAKLKNYQVSDNTPYYEMELIKTIINEENN